LLLVQPTAKNVWRDGERQRERYGTLIKMGKTTLYELNIDRGETDIDTEQTKNLNRGREVVSGSREHLSPVATYGGLKLMLHSYKLKTSMAQTL
jgi:hypothetical protein